MLNPWRSAFGRSALVEGPLRVFVGIALFYVCCGQMGAQTVGISFYADPHGQTKMSVHSAGLPFSFDMHAVRFQWQKYDDAARLTGAPESATVHIGSFLTTASGPPDKVVERDFQTGITLEMPPSGPGLYRLIAISAGTFAHDRDGTPLVPALQNAEIGAVDVYFADQRDNDAALQGLRRRLINKNAYFFGGLPLGCMHGNEAMPPATPFRIVSLKRSRGMTFELRTGTQVHAENDDFPAFLAVDPVEIKIDACGIPLRVADPWHVDVTLTTTPPPTGLTKGTIQAGSTRQAVMWVGGYPNVLAHKDVLDRAARWDYTAPPPSSWSVTFANDRVVKYDPPRMLP